MTRTTWSIRMQKTSRREYPVGTLSATLKGEQCSIVSHIQIEGLFQGKVSGSTGHYKQVIMLGSSVTRRSDWIEYKNHFVNLGILSCNLVLSYFAFITLSSPIIVIVCDGEETLNFLNCEERLSRACDRIYHLSVKCFREKDSIKFSIYVYTMKFRSFRLN